MLELGFATEPANYKKGEKHINHCIKIWYAANMVTELTNFSKTRLFGHWILFKRWWRLTVHHFTTHIFKICTHTQVYAYWVSITKKHWQILEYSYYAKLLAAVEIAELTWNHGQGKTKLVGEEVLSRNFTHIYTHSYASAVLQVPKHAKSEISHLQT